MQFSYLFGNIYKNLRKTIKKIVLHGYDTREILRWIVKQALYETMRGI